MPIQAEGKTLFLCLSARHRGELRRSLGPGIIPTPCPLDVLELLEISTPQVILDRCDSPRPCCQRSMAALESRLAMRLEQISPVKRHSGMGKSHNGGMRFDHRERLREILQYMQQRSRSPLNLSEIGAHFGVTPRQITRLFHRAGLESPMRQIRRMQLRDAYQMVETTDVPFETISEVAGFSDGSTFRRGFLRTFGVSPACLRRHSHRM